MRSGGKKYLWVAAAALLLALLAAGWCVHLPARLGEAMLHFENRLLPYALSRTVTRRLPPQADELSRALALLAYTHLVISPKGPSRTWGETWWLINGAGWCDHSARVFTALLEPLDIKGYTAYLLTPQGKSPHSVAYFTPGQAQALPPAALAQKALVGDTLYGVVWRAPDGAVATPRRICGQDCRPWPVDEQARQDLRPGGSVPTLLRREFFCQAPKIAKQNRPLSSRGPGARLFYGRVLPLLPSWALRWYLDLALWLVKGEEITMGVVRRKVGPAEYEFYRARAHHLFLEPDQAQRAYRQVMARYPASPWAGLARHDLARLGPLRDLLAALASWDPLAAPSR